MKNQWVSAFQLPHRWRKPRLFYFRYTLILFLSFDLLFAFTHPVSANPIKTAVAAFIEGPNTRCANDAPTILTEAGGEGIAWMWSTGATTQSISVSPVFTTLYTVTVTTLSGTEIASKNLTVYTNPANVSAMASQDPVLRLSI
ncbi:MAG: hypothetical protein M3R25_11485 [Bacteroidota bacterium]|nr:hypothetical protein [Bacteroidota bacterium]